MIERCAPASHLYIAVPAYTGYIAADCAHSLIEASAQLERAGIRVTSDFMCGCCYLDHTRNLLATRFMLSDATDLMFIDADVGFDPAALLRIAAANRPFIAGIYPKKSDEVEFPVAFDVDMIWGDQEGYVEAAQVPTGFLRLNRSVMEAMPHDLYDFGKVMNFFDAGVRNDGEHGAKYTGEDWHFSAQWRAQGGKIYIIPDLTFRHIGMRGWTGNWAEWMRSRRQDAA